MNNDNEENESNAIDLGEGPNDNEMAAPTPNQQPTYPVVTLSGDHRLHNMAEMGTHTIHAKVISKHMPHRGSKHHKVELEIHSIKPQMKRGRPTSKPSEDDASHIKKLMETQE